MLGCGNTRGYELLAAGELESFLDGRARKITVASIHAYVARQLADAGAAARLRKRPHTAVVLPRGLPSNKDMS